MIRGAAEIRDAYRVESVARRYLEERFRQPLGALLHDRQAASLRRALEQHRPLRVLEIAPGPARLTTEVAKVFHGYGLLMDASAEMLAEARHRLGRNTRWKSVQGDVFALPFRGEFDLVYSFRLIRHFEEPERKTIYRQIAATLKPGGRLIFDAINEVVSAPLRARAKPDEYEHYDALLRPAQLAAELAECGFDVESTEGVQHRYRVLSRIQVLVAPRSKTLARSLMNLVDATGGEPLEWIVTCRRK